MGRLKRNKTYRKCLQFYELNFGIRKPYRLVLDGNFMHTACRNSVPLRDKLPSLLGDPEAELLVPFAVVTELEKIGEPVKTAKNLAMTFKRLKYGSGATAAEAIKDIIGAKNKNRYIVCTQDESLRDELNKIPGTPTIYLNKCSLVLEPPSRASTNFHRKIEAKKVVPRREERRRLQARSAEGGDGKAAHKRKDAKVKKAKKPKGLKSPNPLSCQKRKPAAQTQNGTSADGDAPASKRKRRRRKQQSNDDDEADGM